MPPRHHVVITGTGRAGTTFLVELLTDLGLETGFSTEDAVRMKRPHARAGLEHDIRHGDCPFIVKSPLFCGYADDVLQRDDIVIDHVFIPMRNLQGAADSRRYVSTERYHGLSFASRMKAILKRRSFPGGLAGTRSTKPGAQEDVLLRQIYDLTLALADTVVPVTLLRYPRLIKDCEYLFAKLQPILAGVELERFHASFDRIARPSLVHSFNAEDR
jgi:hypothetical protein